MTRSVQNRQRWRILVDILKAVKIYDGPGGAPIASWIERRSRVSQGGATYTRLYGLKGCLNLLYIHGFLDVKIVYDQNDIARKGYIITEKGNRLIQMFDELDKLMPLVAR